MSDFTGDKRRYRLPQAPTFRGGQADVFQAIRRDDDAIVAFKRLKSPYGKAKQRMRREISVQSSLASPHVMPILDAAADATWLVMPWADGSMRDVNTWDQKMVGEVLAQASRVSPT